jgi:hypothetical protein
VARAATPGVRTIDLPTGRLRVRVAQDLWPLDRLCDFAARHNPRRGFLVVSKVLGRHWPVSPAVIRDSVRDLAAQIPVDLPGPVAVVGLAETAVGLGQTLHAEWRQASGRDDIFYFHSTRQVIDSPLLGRFEEPHSHASAHLLYEPLVDLGAAPRSLILVDDEVSTGGTFANIGSVLLARWPSIERVVVASLADWSGDGAWLTRLPCPTTRVSLLRGDLEWTPAPVAVDDHAAFDAVAGSLGRLDPHRNRGRLGVTSPDMDLPDTPDLPPRSRLRIVGTGEFTYPPFRLAEAMAARGHDVVVQATSRSPVRIGGPIATALRFADNYDTGVLNFLYNADPADGRVSWVCHETPGVDPALLAALDATAIWWPA